MNFQIKIFADVAQLVEQLFCKQSVVGSSPTIGSSNNSELIIQNFLKL